MANYRLAMSIFPVGHLAKSVRAGNSLKLLRASLIWAVRFCYIQETLKATNSAGGLFRLATWPCRRNGGHFGKPGNLGDGALAPQAHRHCLVRGPFLYWAGFLGTGEARGKEPSWIWPYLP